MLTRRPPDRRHCALHRSIDGVETNPTVAQSSSGQLHIANCSLTNLCLASPGISMCLVLSSARQSLLLVRKAVAPSLIPGFSLGERTMLTPPQNHPTGPLRGVRPWGPRHVGAVHPERLLAVSWARAEQPRGVCGALAATCI